VVDVNEVPRSVRRLTFGEGPLLPPWPVTKTASQADWRRLPALPDPPKALDPASFAATYSGITNDVRATTSEVRQGESFERAAKAFSRINASSKLPGFNWQLVVFESSGKFAFGVPDGTIFLSDGLVGILNDDELTAIVAHVIGHEAYDHDRAFWHDRLFWKEAGPVKKTGAVVGATVLIAAGVGVALFVGPAGYQGILAGGRIAEVGVGILGTTTDYSSYQEVQANYIAIKYLAEIGIPPDTLFDALVKLAPSASQAAVLPSQKDGLTMAADFADADHAEQSASDLGRMLATGVISNSTRVEPKDTRAQAIGGSAS